MGKHGKTLAPGLLLAVSSCALVLLVSVPACSLLNEDNPFFALEQCACDSSCDCELSCDCDPDCDSPCDCDTTTDCDGDDCSCDAACRPPARGCDCPCDASDECDSNACICDPECE